MRGIHILGAMASACLYASMLSGCTQPSDDLAEDRKSLVAVTQRLADSTERSSLAQEELARIQAARTAPVAPPLNEKLEGVPPELLRPTTMEWSGPAHEGARKLAALAGYEFRLVGNPPATPPTANISKRDVPVIKVLEDLGTQSQPFGQVVVDPSAHRVEFRYLNNARPSPAPRRESK